MAELKTYEVYEISCGVKALILRTAKKREAVKKYTALVNTGHRPRVSVDGNQLTISEADKHFNQNSCGRKH